MSQSVFRHSGFFGLALSLCFSNSLALRFEHFDGAAAAVNNGLAKRSFTAPPPSSWTPGACTLTTFADPASTISCSGSTIAPMTVTACGCPDKSIYEKLSGGTGDACHDYISNAQQDLLEAIFSCPASTAAPASTPASTSGSSSIAATASPGSTLTTRLSSTSTPACSAGSTFITFSSTSSASSSGSSTFSSSGSASLFSSCEAIPSSSSISATGSGGTSSSASISATVSNPGASSATGGGSGSLSVSSGTVTAGASGTAPSDSSSVSGLNTNTGSVTASSVSGSAAASCTDALCVFSEALASYSTTGGSATGGTASTNTATGVATTGGSTGSGSISNAGTSVTGSSGASVTGSGSGSSVATVPSTSGTSVLSGATASTGASSAPSGSPALSGSTASLGSATSLSSGATLSASASSITALPSDAGQFIVGTPVYPSTCSSANVVYSSVQAVPTGQLEINPNVGWGKVGNTWTFSASSGYKIVSMSGTSNPDTSGQFEGEPAEPAANNFTQTANGDWQMIVVPNMPTLSILAITSGGSPGATFKFTITALVPCDLPVAYACNVTNDDLTPDQWMAFQVDDFLAEYTKNYSATGKQAFWEDFVTEFIGDAFATDCTVDQDNGCGPITNPCTDVMPTPYGRQAYLVMSAMMTLSRYLHFAYAAYSQSDTDLGDVLPAWDTVFEVPQKTMGWEQGVAAAASVFGILAVIGFAAAPFSGGATLAIGALGSGLFGINALLNGAINFANAGGEVAAAELQFDTWAQAIDAMDNYINTTQEALINTHNSYFLQGTNVSETLKGGIFVGDNMIKSVTDSSVSGFVKQAAGWFDRQAVLGLINQAWKQNDNYVVFIPYGPIGMYGRGDQDFQLADCQSRFMNNGKWNGTIYASCDAGPDGHPGMSMFMVPQNGAQTNEYNSKSFYDIQGYVIDGTYTFSANDVLKSSLAGYFQQGFNYNATLADVTAGLDAQNTNPLNAIATINPWDPGQFNLPVCVIYDFKYVPACTITDWGNENDPCVTQPDFCLGTGSNTTTPSGQVQFFKDYASQDIIDGLNQATCYEPLAC